MNDSCDALWNSDDDEEMSAVVDMNDRTRRKTNSDPSRSPPTETRTANPAVVGARRRASSFRCHRNSVISTSDTASERLLEQTHLNSLREPLLTAFPNDNVLSINETTSYTPLMRDKLRRKIKYNFMNPVEKWKAKRKIPWKLIVQIIKLIVITLQVCLYGMQMSYHITHQGNVATTFRELFLQQWDAVREVMAYPPSAGPYAIYEKDDFYQYIDYAVKALSNISTQSIGSFGYTTNSSHKVSPIQFCQKHYLEGSADPSSFVFKFNTKIVDSCSNIEVNYTAGDPKWNNFSSEKYFKEKNVKIVFERLLSASIHFDIRMIYINSLESTNAPQCYLSSVVLKFDNTLHDGQMVVSLESSNAKRVCRGNIVDSSETVHMYVSIVLNVISIVLCSFSLVLCVNSLCKEFQLKSEVVDFFRQYFGHELSRSEKYQFIDLWIVTIILNDILVIIGSMLESQIEYQQNENYHYNLSAIFLGVGLLLVWIGVLRYLSFFRKYNILILTMKRAIPDVLRFMLCAVILYGGFCICGWIVLGPYHIKFRTLSTTSECLFSLLNGDDMFATFAILSEKNLLVWWFSRLYLYLFIALFIYVVLSLFISLIMDSYETIKEYYEHGFPQTDLEKFIAECPDDPLSEIYRIEDESSQCLSWRSVLQRCGFS